MSNGFLGGVERRAVERTGSELKLIDMRYAIERIDRRVTALHGFLESYSARLDALEGHRLATQRLDALEDKL